MNSILRKNILFFLLFSLPFLLPGKEKGEIPASFQEYDLNIPYREEALGILFPGKLGGFTKRFVRMNANENIGTMIHYDSPGGFSLDIYIYSAPPLPGEASGGFLLRNYRAARKLLFSMEQEKKREDMPEREELFFRDENISAPQNFPCASFSFTAGEEIFRSILAMTVLEKGNIRRLLKIRFSLPAEQETRGRKKWELFRKELLPLLFPPEKEKKS